MQKYKKGFTLSEVLIVITVMSVILAASVGTLKVIQNSYSSLAYFAYNNIKDMVTEVVAGRMPMETGGETTMYCLSNSKGIVNVLTPDAPEGSYSRYATVAGNSLSDCPNLHKITSGLASYSKYNTAGTYLSFCDALLEKVNTKGNTHCESLYTASGTNALNVDNYATAVPTFVGTNGQRYFLSKRVYASNISSDFGYRIMAVDLNGTREPNTDTDSGQGKVPDVITFIIFDNGVVLPTGTAASNAIRGGKTYFYFTAKINAKKEGATPSSTYIKINDSNSEIVYSFKEAFCEATDERPLSEYCTLAQQKCPPTKNDYDSCNIELVKPAFRYNL